MPQMLVMVIVEFCFVIRTASTRRALHKPGRTSRQRLCHLGTFVTGAGLPEQPMNFVYVPIFSLQISEARRITRKMFTYYLQVSIWALTEELTAFTPSGQLPVLSFISPYNSNQIHPVPFTRVFSTCFTLLIAKGCDLGGKG